MASAYSGRADETSIETAHLPLGAARGQVAAIEGERRGQEGARKLQEELAVRPRPTLMCKT